MDDSKDSTGHNGGVVLSLFGKLAGLLGVKLENLKG
jgi:hypothetical protein